MTATSSNRIKTTDIIYSDFINDLVPHPVHKDIVRYINEHAVTSSIRNLILTDAGERLYTPDVGGSIRSLLFENINGATAESISMRIQLTISKYEPRAMALNVVVVPYYDSNAYVVTVTYSLINKSDPVTVNITLNRVR